MVKNKKKKKNIPSFSKGNKDRYRKYFILLYKDTESYSIDDVLFNLKGYKNWAYIEHKKEKKEKKDHIHFVLSLDNACTKSSISKKTGVPTRFIEPIINERAVCRYLVHADDEDKIQYSIDDVKCSRGYLRFFKKQLEDKESEEEVIINIYSFIDKIAKENSTYKEIMPLLILYINSNCYDTIYKRYRNEFNFYLQNVL